MSKQSRIEFKAFVVMGNDYPDAVFASEAEAEAHIKRKQRADKKVGKHIYWRAIEFPLTYNVKMDTDNAQSILREALMRICIECGLQKDWATFITVAMCCVSATVAEVAPLEQLKENGGRAIIEHMLSQFGGMIEDSFNDRIEFEKNKLKIN